LCLQSTSCSWIRSRFSQLFSRHLRNSRGKPWIEVMSWVIASSSRNLLATDVGKWGGDLAHLLTFIEGMVKTMTPACGLLCSWQTAGIGHWRFVSNASLFDWFPIVMRGCKYRERVH
jgi:hypothetical protein